MSKTRRSQNKRRTAPAADGQGLRYNNGKVLLSLMPTDAQLATAQVFTVGARKYAPRNWERGMKWSICFDSLMRHLLAFWSGEDVDPETGLPHLAHAQCNVMFLLAYHLRGLHQLDDREHLARRYPARVPLMMRVAEPKTPKKARRR